MEEVGNGGSKGRNKGGKKRRKEEMNQGERGGEK
jgi:hypothetical protein